VLVNGVAHTVNIVGPTVYSDSALTQVVAMPATVSSDTVWYVASRSAHPNGFGVTVALVSTGARWSATNRDWVPGTIDCIAHAIDLSVTAEDDSAIFSLRDTY